MVVPKYEIVSVEPSTVYIKPRQWFKLRVTVRNNGDTGKCHVVVWNPKVPYGPVGWAPDTVIPSGGTRTFEITVNGNSFEEQKTYRVYVYTVDVDTRTVSDQKIVYVVVTQPPPPPPPTPKFKIENVTPTHVKVAQGQPYKLTVTIRNNGDKEGRGIVEVIDMSYKRGWLQGKAETDIIPPGGTQTLVIECVGFDKPGTYTVDVRVLCRGEHDRWSGITVEVTRTVLAVKEVSITPETTTATLNPIIGFVVIGFTGTAKLNMVPDAPGKVYADIYVNERKLEETLEVGTYTVGATEVPIRFSLKFCEPGKYTVKAYVYTDQEKHS